MAEKGKNGNRNYRKEYDTYHGTPEQRAKNNQRKAARRAYEKAHGDLPANVDIDHKKLIKDGGTNNPNNLRAVPESVNSGWRKGRKGYK